MDYAKKMEDLETLWEDSFQVCRGMVDAAKSGEMKLNASLLKELNAFIKQSVDFLRYRESEQAFSEDAPQDEEDEKLERLLDEVQADIDDMDRPMQESLELPDDVFTAVVKEVEQEEEETTTT